jgi:hypothetical protein
MALDPLVPVTITPNQGAADGTVRVSIPACSAGTIVSYLVFGDRERTPANPIYQWQLPNSGPAHTYRRVGLGNSLPGFPDFFEGLPTPVEVDVDLGAADKYRNYTPSTGDTLNLWIACFTPNTDGYTYGMKTTGSFTLSTPEIPTSTPEIPASTPETPTPGKTDRQLTVGAVTKLPPRQRFGKAKYTSATPKVCKVIGGKKVKALAEGACLVKPQSVSVLMGGLEWIA